MGLPLLGMAVVAGSGIRLSATEGDSPKRGEVVLHNKKWEEVEVEVSRGREEACDRNPSLGTRAMLRDQSRVIRCTAEEHVCWRRELHPDNDDDERWTEWTGIRCPEERAEFEL